jgi:hypothetical protein
LLFVFAFSCKGAPVPQDTDPDVSAPLIAPDEGDTVLEDINDPSPEIPEITADLPAELLQEGDGGDDGDAAALEEPPPLDFPETIVPPPSPEENTTAIAVLPDVQAPAFQETPPAAPEPVPPVVSATPPVIPVTPPRQEPVPAPKPIEQPKVATPGGTALEVPAPPPFLRIPEPVTPPLEREIVPVTPLPELPARTPSPAAPSEEVVFSRVVRATVGQLVEVPFRGTGWVYLGELGSRRGLTYDSRRLDQDGQSFIFRAEAVGTYALKFYKQDFIRDYILNDYVQVIVGEASDSAGLGWFNPPVDRGRVIAEPRWPPIEGDPAAEPPAPTRPVISDDGIAPVPQATASGIPAQSPPQELPSPDMNPAEYVNQARQEYDAGRVDSALSILDQLKQQFAVLTDEALWLYAQLLEANSPNRDIRLALEYYRILIREYPQSPRVPEAQQRISYLERYYFNLR